MSIKAMTWARDQKVGGGTTKLILLLLADYADDDGHCWPGMETVAEKAEVNESTVRRHMTTLVKKGFMTRRRKRRADGTMSVYEYWLAIGDHERGSDDAPSGPGVADPPAGKSSGGPSEEPELPPVEPETPHGDTPKEADPQVANPPAGKSSGGQEPTSGENGSGHRAMTHEPPGNLHAQNRQGNSQ